MSRERSTAGSRARAMGGARRARRRRGAGPGRRAGRSGNLARAEAHRRRDGRRELRRGHRVHAAQPHGAHPAPARPHRARGHPHDEAQPRQLRELSRRPQDGPRHRQQGRVLRGVPQLCGGEARLLRMPRRPGEDASTASEKRNERRRPSQDAKGALGGSAGVSRSAGLIVQGRRPRAAADPRLGRSHGRRRDRSRHHAVRPRARSPAVRTGVAHEALGHAGRRQPLLRRLQRVRRRVRPGERTAHREDGDVRAVDPQGRVEGHARRRRSRCR